MVICKPKHFHTYAVNWVDVFKYKFSVSNYTRKYWLCGCVLGVLTHTTAWGQHWGGDETLKWVLMFFENELFCDLSLIGGTGNCLHTYANLTASLPNK